MRQLRQRRAPLGRFVRIQPDDAQARFALHAPVAADDADHQLFSVGFQFPPVAAVALRPGRREDDVERAIRADGEIVKIIGVLRGVMLAGAQRVGAKLRQNQHPHGAAIAPDAVGAALLDQRSLVDGVGIGLKDILADIEFRHEDRMAAVVQDRVVGGAQHARQQQAHRFLHHLRVVM